MSKVLERWTLSFYPSALKYLFSLFDVPENICVSRTTMCGPQGFAALTRIQVRV